MIQVRILKFAPQSAMPSQLGLRGDLIKGI
jgi:hypothetical protein